jgi:hypothetical protein
MMKELFDDISLLFYTDVLHSRALANITTDVSDFGGTTIPYAV